ncbi:MAG: ABC transporter ATP-binding protein [Hyphomicrobiales bacterium]
MADLALSISALSAGYGDTVVLEDIGFEMGEGDCISILGRNGVGKTTLLETVMGHTTLKGGEISLLGEAITREQVHKRVTRGLGYVPQEREIFPSLTVAENLEVAARPGEWGARKVYDFFPQLEARRANRGNQLSGGEQQMLAIGRALMGNPKVMLMDEPSEGLAPVVVEELKKGMERLRDETGMTFILVEQNSRLAMSFAERCLIMNRGRIVHDGASAELAKDEELLTRLLGVEGAAG